MPAPERVPSSGLTPDAPGAPAPGPGDGRAADDPLAPLEFLIRGELTVEGRLREASNAVLYCAISYGGREAHCVYKPIAGERPLWDFPDGDLASREVAAFLVSEATGWDLVPPTVMRDGPYGAGMCQLWIEADDGQPMLALVEEDEPGPGWKAVVEAGIGGGRTALLVHADDERLRRLAVLDAVINNADRKGGHLLPTADGRLYGIDHGVSFHTDDKLRTLLWGWAGEPLTPDARTVLRRLGAALTGELGVRLAELLTEAETAALRERVAVLLAGGRHPVPSGNWPSIPWPPV